MKIIVVKLHDSDKEIFCNMENAFEIFCMWTLMAVQWQERKDAGVDAQEGMFEGLHCIRYCLPQRMKIKMIFHEPQNKMYVSLKIRHFTCYTNFCGDTLNTVQVISNMQKKQMKFDKWWPMGGK